MGVDGWVGYVGNWVDRWGGWGMWVIGLIDGGGWGMWVIVR